MGRKINSGLSVGSDGQLSIENYELISLLQKQKEHIKNNIDSAPDFYVGPNGKILSAKYRNWIGVSRRNELLKKSKNPMLKNTVDQLYRPKSFIGDGGTASVVLFERKTKLNLGRNGGSHEKKAREMISYIERKILTQNLSAGDRKLANKLAKDLKKALVR